MAFEIRLAFLSLQANQEERNSTSSLRPLDRKQSNKSLGMFSTSSSSAVLFRTKVWSCIGRTYLVLSRWQLQGLGVIFE